MGKDNNRDANFILMIILQCLHNFFGLIEYDNGWKIGMKNILKTTPLWLIITGSVLILTLVGVVGFFAFKPKNQFETQKAAMGPITSNIEATGTVEARQSSLIRWMSSGIVGEVYAKTGDHVAAEIPLALLDLNTVGPKINNAYSDLFLAEAELDVVLNSNTSLNDARNRVSTTYDDMVTAQNYYDWVVAPRSSEDLNEYLDDDISDVEDQLKYMEFIEEFFYADMTDNNPKKIQFNLQVLQLEQAKTDQIARWNWFNGKPSQTDIDLAAARLEVAKAAYADAVRVYERMEANGSLTEKTQAMARVDADKSVAGQALLINTIEGELTMLEVKPGDYVRAGQVGARVDDLSGFLVKLFLSEVDVNRVQVGGPVLVSSESDPSINLTGTIKSIELAGRRINNAMAYEVMVSIEGDTHALKPGNTVSLLIEVDKVEQALLVPTRALRIYEGQKIVFVLRDQVETPIVVRIGIRNSENTQIVGGDLEVGDEIILNPPSVSTLDGVIIQ